MKINLLSQLTLALLLAASPAHAVTKTVDNSNDAGPGSLRQIITDADPGDVIVFDLATVTSPILLTSGELVLDKALTIQGPGAGLLAVSGNRASRVFRVSGGGHVVIESLTLQDGRPPTDPDGYATVGGGAIYNYGAALAVVGCVLAGNEAEFGGGIYNEGGDLTLTDTTVRDNLASLGGAVMNEGNLHLEGCTLSGNIASLGGGLCNFGAASLVNSTLSGNLGTFGGGILNYVVSDSVTLSLRHCTLSGNAAGSGGGGIFNLRDRYSGGPNLTLSHTLLANSPAGGNYFEAGTGLAISEGYNRSDDATLGLVLTQPGDEDEVGDLLLGPLADNGGATFTHALQPGSRAVNAGDPDLEAASLPYDQRGPGFARVVGSQVDIGAFELNGCDSPVVKLTGPAGGAVFAVGVPVTFTATFSGNSGPHLAVWTIGGQATPGTVDEAAGTVTATVTFSAAGIYPVALTVANACGLTGSATTVGDAPARVVLYDPAAGFVTGGGWVQSPTGALLADPAATGKANFSFVVRYLPGGTRLVGNTEFQFKAGDMNFKGAGCDWLVVNGATAQFQGAGTVNGTQAVRFQWTITDGRQTGGPDLIRILIWDAGSDTVIYDSQPGAPADAAPSTPLGGGSIVLHH